MKKGDLALYISLAVIIFIFFGIFFLPMFIVYGGFGLLDPLATKERYTLSYYIYLESREPFENVTVLIPAAKLGSLEIVPANFEIVKIGNRTYIKIAREKPYYEIYRLHGENETLTNYRYRMDITVEFPEIKIENLTEYRIDDGNVSVLLDYTNSSYVSLHVMLYYLELDYVDIFGKRIYTNLGHYNYLWCKTTPVNITEDKRGRWMKVPVSCGGEL